MLDALSQFRDAIQSGGLTPPDAIEPGKFHKFPGEGKRNGNTAGWCKLFPDGMGGIYGDYSTGLSAGWQANRETPYTPAERESFKRHVAEAKAQAEAEEAQGHEAAAGMAATIWQKGKEVPKEHSYLKRKGIGSHGTKVHTDGRLLVPMRDVVGKLWNIERIAPEKPGDGSPDKKGLYRGKRTGCYFSIGTMKDAAALAICEGFATGASIHEATGLPVAVAFNAGNLGLVAKAMREKFPALPLILCGDFDKSGTGQKAATAAAQAVGGLVALPDFTPEEMNTDKPPSDFNDLAQLRGADAVGRAIASAMAPDKPTHQPDSARASAGEYASSVELLRGSDVAPEAVTWLWPGWLAAGKMHVLGGAPGTGKTTISMALAATVTTGGRWPDGSRSPAGNVVIWSGEDDPADTLVPRLALSGADLSRVYFIADVFDGDGRRAFDPARDMEPLRRKLAEIGDVRLLIVDPIVSAVMGDSHKNAEVRRSLQPLVDLAAFMRCALLGITHFSKGTGGRDPVERLTGSLAFGALARVVMVAAKHQEEGEDGRTVRLFIRAKSNIGPDDGGFEYDLHQGELKTHPGIFASSVLWGDAVEGAARELLATADATGDDGEGGTQADARRFLSDLLADGSMPVKSIKADADGAGYSWATIRRAQKALGIEAVKEGGHFGNGKQQWVWKLPATEGAQVEHLQADSLKVLKNAEDAQQKELSAFRKVEHLQGNSAAVVVEI